MLEILPRWSLQLICGFLAVKERFKNVALIAAVLFTGVAWAQNTVTLTAQEALFNNIPSRDSSNFNPCNGSTPGGCPSGPTAAGIARTNEPVTVGVPIPDAWGVSQVPTVSMPTGTNGLWQTLCEAHWPSGHCKWLLIDTQVPSLSAGSTTSFTLSTSGTGSNSGQTAIAVDSSPSTPNSGTITVSTGTATFVIRKASFDGFDSVSVGATNVVATGTSDGLVVTGPAYPATTCSSPPTNCSTDYKSSNDTASTAVIERNGPALAIVRADGALKDGSSNVYMRFTVRMTFYANKSYVSVKPILRNADQSVPGGNFASAYKGLRAWEFRVKLVPQTSPTAIFSTSSSPFTYTYSGSENAFFYQAYSTAFEADATSSTADGFISPITRSSLGSGINGNWIYAQDGYTVIANGTSRSSGNDTTSPDGWADCQASGKGVLIGSFYNPAYWPKSEECLAGGSDVRVGMRPDQTLFNGSGIPYYVAWPTYEIDNLYFEFHSSALASDAADFQKWQRFLVAYETPSYLNTANVFPVKMMDESAINQYWHNVFVAANPATGNDFGANPQTDWQPTAKFAYGWNGPGVGNQSDPRWAYLLHLSNYHFTGQYLWAMMFNKYIMESYGPRADGFTWRSYSNAGCGDAAQTCMNLLGWPQGITSANSSLAGGPNISENEDLHDHAYGMFDWYLSTGDQTYLDWLKQVAVDRYTDFRRGASGAQTGWFSSFPGCLTKNGSGVIQSSNCLTISREIGVKMIWAARGEEFFNSIGDTTDASGFQTLGNNMFTYFTPDLLISGTGTSLTFDLNLREAGATDVSTGINYPVYGLSRTRGFWLQDFVGHWTTASPFNLSSCQSSSSIAPAEESAEPYMYGIAIRGLYELTRERGTSWTNYNLARDLAYGMARFVVSPTDGSGVSGGASQISTSSSWLDTNVRYAVPNQRTCNLTGGVTGDNPPACDCLPGWAFTDQDIDDAFAYVHDYDGSVNPEEPLLERSWQKIMAGFSATSFAENYYMVENAMYGFANSTVPNISPSGVVTALPLNTVAINVTNNGGGSYTITWTPPTGVQSYKLKHASGKQIVDWLNFDVSHGPCNNFLTDPCGTWGIDPTTHVTWFGANYTGTQPAANNNGSITVTTDQGGGALATNEQFMLKAALGSAPTGPAVTFSPASLTFASQTVGTTSAAQAITLTNGGTATLNIASIAITSTNSGDFSQTNTCGTSLGAGASCNIAITFTPVAAGSRSASVLISDNDPGSPQSVALSGTGASSGGSAVLLAPSSLTFSSQPVGSSSASQTVTLTNNGQSALNLTSISITGDFGFDSTMSCPTGAGTLAANSNCTIKVTFSPIQSGTRSGVVTINDNGASNPQSISLTGTGSGSSSATWKVICDGSGNGLTGPGPNCVPSDTVPNARGYNQRLPYDTVNHEFLYYAGDMANTTIYSYHLWAYNTTTHTFSSRINDGSTGDGSCAFNNPAGQALNPLQSHPEGNNAFDSGHGQWIYVPGVCSQWYSGQTNLYNASSRSMLPPINQWPNSPTCDGGFNCSIASDQAMEYVPTYGKTIWCCSNNGSGMNMAEFDGSKWTNITSLLGGTMPPMPRTAFGMVSDGTYLYVYGGCIGSSPADSSANTCNGTIDNNLYRYAPTTHHWDLMSPTGGTKPPAMNDFPFIAYDSTRNRFVLWAENSDRASGSLWQYDIPSNTWTQVPYSGTPFAWTTNVASASVTMDGGVDGDMAGYDPIADTMVLMFFRNQANSPAVYELSFGSGGVPTVFNLVASKTGTGSGTITSADGFINCGSNCIHSYNNGDSVVLTATPSAGSTFTGWSGDCSGTADCSLTMSINHSVTAAFTASGPPPAPPTVAITTPNAGASVSGTITVTATASDNVAISSVSFQVDGTQIGSTLTSAPYSVLWNTTAFANGTHTLSATAQNVAGGTASASISIIVNNETPPPPAPPTVTITTPNAGATVSGTITIAATVSDNIAISNVSFRANGTAVGSPLTTAPYSVAWNTAALANGTYTLSATAQNVAGGTTTATINVTVSNQTASNVPPKVAITAPAARSTVGGTVTISATASDSLGVTGVLFQVDGSQVGTEVSSSPYSTLWDSRTVTNGPHTLTAVARDPAGNQASASIMVVVSNSSPQPGGLGQVTTDSNTQFSVDVQDLDVLIACATCWFQSAADMLPGQTTEVWIRPGTSPPVANKIILKMGSIEGTVIRVGTHQFVIQTGPTSVWPPTIVVITGSVTDFLNIPNGAVQVGQKVSVFGLLFKSGMVGSPNVVARKVQLRP